MDTLYGVKLTEWLYLAGQSGYVKMIAYYYEEYQSFGSVWFGTKSIKNKDKDEPLAMYRTIELN